MCSTFFDEISFAELAIGQFIKGHIDSRRRGNAATNGIQTLWGRSFYDLFKASVEAIGVVNEILAFF